jgi:hypothetical protein
MYYSLTQQLEPLSVDLMLGKLWNALNRYVCGVALDVFSARSRTGRAQGE